jgi:hypothetical protein
MDRNTVIFLFALTAVNIVHFLHVRLLMKSRDFWRRQAFDTLARFGAMAPTAFARIEKAAREQEEIEKANRS